MDKVVEMPKYTVFAFKQKKRIGFLAPEVKELTKFLELLLESGMLHGIIKEARKNGKTTFCFSGVPELFGEYTFRYQKVSG